LLGFWSMHFWNGLYQVVYYLSSYEKDEIF
jgi:hypothetical protein